MYKKLHLKRQVTPQSVYDLPAVWPMRGGKPRLLFVGADQPKKPGDHRGPRLLGNGNASRAET
jgi:hypothetical protein